MLPKQLKDSQRHQRQPKQVELFLQSNIIVLLTHTTRKGMPWSFSPDAQQSFEALKSAFTSAPILSHWIPNWPLIVETDASNYALDAILSIQNDSGKIHPVTFHSCTFTSLELNYDTNDKELLAIFDAFCIWKHYLEGSATPIDLVTGHKNTFVPPKSLLTDKSAGPNTFVSSTF